MRKVYLFYLLTYILIFQNNLGISVNNSGNLGLNQNTIALDLIRASPNLSFDNPVDIQFPDDGSNRLFVVEQDGRIHYYENTENVKQSHIFLDITDRVDSSGYEEGLLGLAFDPNFEENSFFYVYYTGDSVSRISRFMADVDSGNGDINSEQIILEIDQPYDNHNGGQIAFGPDGYLYAGIGDGGSGGDPHGNGQNAGTLLGSILRLDVTSSPDSGLNYAIPKNNPFVGHSELRAEVYAYGLRNPWRFSFDLETDKLWLADVGQSNWEEVDVIEEGGNYGWNIMEGFHCYNPSTDCNQTGLIPPIIDYNHNIGQSITGGYVYRGSAIENLIGQYIFADFESGRIWCIDSDSQNPEMLELFDTSHSIPTFGQDPSGELYLASFDGKIYKFVPEGYNDYQSDDSSEDGFVNSFSLYLTITGVFIIVLINRQKRRFKF